MGVRRNFCVDVYAEVSLCVELYEYVEMYDERQVVFLQMQMTMSSKFGQVCTRSKEIEVVSHSLNYKLYV